MARCTGYVRLVVEMFALLIFYRTALKKPVRPQSVAKSVLFLASENWSGSITGQVLDVDSGKHGKVMWTKDEC